MTVLLSVQGLTKGFGPRPLFADLSLDLRAGEHVGLIGPNGSGKSTLLRLLAGLDEPTNHLDLPGIVWLERLLRAASFAYVVATHDRAFLRAAADEVIEVNRMYPGGFFRAAGSYDDFVRRREEFQDAQARQQQSV